MARKESSKAHRVLILVSAYIAIMLLDGLMYNIGALFVHVMETFKVSRAEAAVVQTSLVVLTTATGVINGSIIGRFGIRRCSVAAATIASFGLSISFFATNIPFLAFSIGACGGIGVSVVYICAFNIISQYFTGRFSSIVMAIVATSTRIGGIIYSYVLLFLSNSFGVRGTFLILGALLFHSVACALCWSLPNTSIVKKYITNERNKNDVIDEGTAKETYTDENDKRIYISGSILSLEVGKDLPTSISKDTSSLKSIDSTNKITFGVNDIPFITTISDSLTQQEDSDNLPPSPTQLHQNEHESDIRVNSQICVEESAKCCNKLLKPETCIAIKSLLKDRIFLSFVFSAAISLQGILTFTAYVADMFKDKGLSDSDTSNALMICNVLAVISSPISGIPCLATLSVPMLSSVAYIIGLSMLLLVNSFELSMIAAAIIGVGFGVFGSFVPVTTEKLVGKNRFHIGLGVVMSFSSITAALGPLIGYLRDITESYQTPIVVVIGLLTLSLVLLCIAQWSRWRQKKSTQAYS